MTQAGYIQESARSQGTYSLLLLALQITPTLFMHLHSSNESSILALPASDAGPRVEYHPAVFTLGSLSRSNDGSFPQTSLNLEGLPSDIIPAMVRGNNGLRGFKLWIIQAHRAFLGPPNTLEEEAARRVKFACLIDGSTITDTSVTLHLASALSFVNGTVPSRMFYRHFCSRRQDEHATTPESTRWADNLCCYADTCDHTKASCVKKNVYSHFMGFPNIPVKGRYYVV